MSTYSPDQAPEPEIGEEPCRHCGHHCESAEECRDSRIADGADVSVEGWEDRHWISASDTEDLLMLLERYGPPAEEGAPF